MLNGFFLPFFFNVLNSNAAEVEFSIRLFGIEKIRSSWVLQIM